MYGSAGEKRDTALDRIFEKLTVIPIQRAWRAKQKGSL